MVHTSGNRGLRYNKSTLEPLTGARREDWPGIHKAVYHFDNKLSTDSCREGRLRMRTTPGPKLAVGALEGGGSGLGDGLAAQVGEFR